MRSIVAALLSVVLAPLSAFAQADSPRERPRNTETLYESSLGPHGGAPPHRTRAQLEAMGGTWVGERFVTREGFANTNDSASATFVTQVTYVPVAERKARERR